MNYFDEVPFGITICDKEGKIIEMNKKSILIFEKKGGQKLIGSSLSNCHSEKANEIINNLMSSEETNVYSIEKNGIKKLIYQCPWYENDEFGGLIELSLELPSEIPHFIRS